MSIETACEMIKKVTEMVKIVGISQTTDIADRIVSQELGDSSDAEVLECAGALNALYETRKFHVQHPIPTHGSITSVRSGIIWAIAQHVRFDVTNASGDVAVAK